MNCPLETRDGAELLVAYSSSKLDAAKAAFLEQHLENCAECRQAARRQRTLWEALDMWEPAPVSADFNRRLYRRIEAQGTWIDRLLGQGRLGIHRTMPLAAAAIVLLAAGIMLDRTAPPPRQPAQTASQVAAVEALQPEQVVEALDEMQALSRFNDLMNPDAPKSKM